LLFSVAKVGRPSSWFSQHSAVIRPGFRVLDLACGSGRHAIAAAELGARVTAIDQDGSKLRTGMRSAQDRRLTVEWVEADLQHHPIPVRAFDLVMIFNYLDRGRSAEFADAVKADGYLMAETFLDAQRQLGWGPESAEHLLRTGELPTLFGSLETILYREALVVSDGRPAAVGSVLAGRRGE
jgi:2-polyprenyl-3-methyl-5-hydroxy-6-metoxy-1,4-benzoquinol methylase